MTEEHGHSVVELTDWTQAVSTLFWEQDLAIIFVERKNLSLCLYMHSQIVIFILKSTLMVVSMFGMILFREILESSIYL